MSTDLFLTVYHRQEHELQQRLEHAHVARERAGDAADRTLGRAAAPSRRTHALVATVTAWFTHGRQVARRAARDASGTSACCSPA